MNFVKEFGVDPVLIGAQVVNFVIIFFLLKRFLYKPVLKVLQERKDLITQTILNAQEAENRLAKVLEEEKTILQNAQKEAAKIVETARTQAEVLRNQAHEQAKTEAAKLIELAREHIRLQTQEAEKQLTRHVSQLTVDFLKSLLPPFLSQKTQQEVLARSMKKIAETKQTN